MQLQTYWRENKRRTLVFLAVAALLVIFLVVFVDVATVYEQLKRIRLSNFVIASGLMALGLIFYALRWQSLLAEKAAFRNIFHIANFGLMFNLIAPYKAGEAARIYLLGKRPDFSMPEATSSVVAERWMEQAMRLVCLVLAIAYGLFLFAHYQTLLSLDLDWSQGQLLAVSLGSMAFGPPSAPGLPGIFHASIVAPLTLLGYNRETMTTFAVILQSIQVIIMFPLGLWGLKQWDRLKP